MITTCGDFTIEVVEPEADPLILTVTHKRWNAWVDVVVPSDSLSAESRRVDVKTDARPTRPLNKIAYEILKEWKTINIHAKPYVKAMTWLHTMDDTYFHDSAEGIVLRFLSNAQHWRGETARRIKAELRKVLKSKSIQ